MTLTVAGRAFDLHRYGHSRLWLAYEDDRPVERAPSRRALRRIIRNRVEGNPPWLTL